MKKIQKSIEIVRSSTFALSSMGEKSSRMIERVLRRYYESVSITIVNNTDDLDAIIVRKPDLVFLGVKRVPFSTSPIARSTYVWVSAYLEQAGINYSGSMASAVALDFDKPSAKRIVSAAGLNTAGFFTATVGEYSSVHELPLGLPLFMKPPNGGGGKGVAADSVIRDFTGYTRKVNSIWREFGTPALVETYLPGREFSVAILESSHSDELLSMPIELITEPNEKGDRILGKQIKSADTEKSIFVADASERALIARLAERVFYALGARDYGRIDIRFDESGTPYFLEANLIPGLAHHDFISYFTHACWLNLGINYEEMIVRIVELGLSRDVVVDESTDTGKNIPRVSPRALSKPVI